MSRPLQPPSSPQTPPSHITATNLTRLLSRLDQKLGFTSPREDAVAPPATSPLERAKIAANLEYARQLLLHLEKESDTIRNLSQRQKALAKLGQQKQVVRRLNEKLQLSAHEVEAEDEDEPDEQFKAMDSEDSSDEGGVSVGGLPTYPLKDNDGKLEKVHSPPPPVSGLRNRFPVHKEDRVALFAGRGDAPGEGEEFTEKQLDSQRREQEDLTEDMLKLAQALKMNSVRFGQELEKEKGLLDLAVAGLDKNVLGIESTGRKMDTLRRDENVGWLWSILYPVIIVTLAFFTLFILFFAPKLRWW